jgi:hypothetical protein
MTDVEYPWGSLDGFLRIWLKRGREVIEKLRMLLKVSIDSRWANIHPSRSIARPRVQWRGWLKIGYKRRTQDKKRGAGERGGIVKTPPYQALRRMSGVIVGAYG